jgi:membrane protease YdiL (CAAX protease family)
MSIALAARRTVLAAMPRAALLSALLLAAAVGRAAINGGSLMAGFVAGAAFGVALLGLALAAGWRPGRPNVRGAAIGLAGGVVLVAIPLIVRGAAPVPLGMRPEPMAAWFAVTMLVVIAEEAVLRGVLFDQLVGLGGPIMAVLATSLLFAAIHVPLYGWAVIPIDVAAGVWLAGLRMASGGILAPAIAHLLADLATWWL